MITNWWRRWLGRRMTMRLRRYRDGQEPQELMWPIKETALNREIDLSINASKKYTKRQMQEFNDFFDYHKP